MVECEICLEKYQEDDLEQHRETCELRLVLRCSICNEDYMNREGLWNHLDLHENIHDKELHCQELRVNHKLHQCTLCNDQRGYSESSYLMHVRNIHGNCEAQNQGIDSESNDLLEELVSVNVKRMTSNKEHVTHIADKLHHMHPKTLLLYKDEQKANRRYIARDEDYIDLTTEPNDAILTIDSKIQYWMNQKKFKMPESQPEIQITEDQKVTVKCWLCERSILLSRRTNKNGTIGWIISNFTQHILAHMRIRKSLDLVK